jgi:hypothetical protein
MKKINNISNDILWRLPTQPKNTDTISNQLAELIKIARRIGMDAAADWILKNNNKKRSVFQVNK